MKLAFIFASIALGIFKLLKIILSSPGVSEFVIWLLSSAMLAWMTLTYWKDKDLPSTSGDFDFHEGKNNTLRVILIALTICAYVVYVIY